MAPLTFPDIVRFSIVGTLYGQDCVNVFDIKVDNTGVPGGRTAEIERLAGDVLNQWSDHILPDLTNDYTANEVRFVDLDSLSGITGAVSSTDGADWPEAGGSASDTLPNSVYAKVVKQLDSHSRTSRNGATRLGGIPENATEPTNANVLTQAWIDGMNANFEAFKDGLNGVEGEWTENLGVLHTIDGVAEGFTFISDFSVASQVGTLRRRMPGYGT